MNEHTFSVVALSNRDFPSIQAKLDEAAKWVTLAAKQGAELVVLPEAMNIYRGDGAGNPHRPSYDDIALEDWQTACASLLQSARQMGVAITVPLITRENGRLCNTFYVVDARGRVAGQYHKMFPTPQELEAGISPAELQPLIEWNGLKLGGGICFDTCFCDGLRQQADAGADVILVPSLWPGGSDLPHFARQYETAVLLAYPAWSRIIDPSGEVVTEGGYRNESLRFGFGSPVYTATINFDRVALYANHNQEKMVEVQSALGSEVRITYDQPNCVFYLESRSESRSAREIMDDFGLISAKDYFADCRRQRDAKVASSKPASASPLVSVQPLVQDGRHNAFTAMMRFRGAIYLTYRSSTGHGETDGDVILRRSTDEGRTWETLASPFASSRNFYEAHMTEHDGKLLMYCGSFRRGGKLDKATGQQFVSVSEDGETWSPMQPACDPCWRFWHPTVHRGKVYVPAYQVDYSELKPDGAIPAHCWTVKLMVSDDGVHFEDVSVISDRDGGSETELRFEDDGTLRAFIRCGAGAKHLIERQSHAPYTDWSEPIDCGQIIEGQLIRKLDGRLFLFGRYRRCTDRTGTIHDDRREVSTRVWVHDGGYWQEYVTLPSGGDTSYAGVVTLGPGRVLMSYYSQHRTINQQNFVSMAGESDVYLAELDTTVPAGSSRVSVHV